MDVLTERRERLLRFIVDEYVRTAQPAGRMPTDKGYRYYVEALMRPQEPPAAVQQTIRHQFHQAAGEAADWAHPAAAVLAARPSYVSLVPAPPTRGPPAAPGTRSAPAR